MAGLVPAISIHSAPLCTSKESSPWTLKLSSPGLSRWSRLQRHCLPKRDGRDKPGHDSVDALMCPALPNGFFIVKIGTTNL